MAETKLVNKINKSPSLKKKLDGEKLKESLLSQAQQGMKSFDNLYFEIERLWEKYEAFHYREAQLIFYPKLLLVMGTDASQKIQIGQHSGKSKLQRRQIAERWEGELLTESEARKVFFEYDKSNRGSNYTQVVCVKEPEHKIGYIVNNGAFTGLVHDAVIEVAVNNIRSIFWTTFLESQSFNKINSVYSVRVPLGYHFNGSGKSKLQIIIEIGYIPDEMKSKKLLKNLVELISLGYVSESKGRLHLTARGRESVEKGICTEIGQVKITKENPNRKSNSQDEAELDIRKMSLEEKETVFEYYADCDKIRANINPYDIAWLEDPNQGHWELWNENGSSDTIKISAGSKVYARNPRSDIRSDCIVGIDFGTKSTVVVCQNESGNIKPLPIGNGDSRKELEVRDFENPTVIQFINVSDFLKNYSEKKGRPYTCWKDLIISHAANESMQDTGVRSGEFYSYLYDLKQWAGEGKRTINIRDKKGSDVSLSSYNNIMKGKDENSFYMDPIEMYAYYIGLYINNMNNGIYLDYLLSFPVTYEKSIRNGILKSFECGLKKSLPESILNDEEVMSRFHVVAGASEPAAYAICALEEYGFEPEEEEKVFYGIFDFGGGTSDFDFGLWTQSSDEELFDYCIEHFGTQGDRYLGGENLLQLLAFEAFSENIQLCRKEKIPFAKPLEAIDIPSELSGFVNESQEARMNQKLMMEKLRPFWERSDDIGNQLIDVKEYNEFQIGLFNVDGVLKSNLPFEVDDEKLNHILYQRIEKGVRQFFEALKDTFSEKHIRKTVDTQLIHIFLAGNSSKSPILWEVFQSKIDEWNKNISQRKEDSIPQGGLFLLFPPLGTESATKLQEERGMKDSMQIESPTGKTGVAWGLIKGREGGRIEVKEEISFDKEAKFSYYLGTQKGKSFNPKIGRDDIYDKWIRFLPARRRVNEILYTSLPEAASGNLLCTEVGVLRKRIEIHDSDIGEGKSIYIRLISTNSIEYAIGWEEGNIDESSIRSESF